MSDINPLQAMLDGMGAHWQRERAGSQMTLGSLIAVLETMPPDAPVEGMGNPHSYRGYYCDLAFESAAERRTASATLAMCRQAMGRTFAGYKGGDFLMGESTPVWVADYGRCGLRIMSLDPATGALTKSEDE